MLVKTRVMTETGYRSLFTEQQGIVRNAFKRLSIGRSSVTCSFIASPERNGHKKTCKKHYCLVVKTGPEQDRRASELL